MRRSLQINRPRKKRQPLSKLRLVLPNRLVAAEFPLHSLDEAAARHVKVVGVEGGGQGLDGGDGGLGGGVLGNEKGDEAFVEFGACVAGDGEGAEFAEEE